MNEDLIKTFNDYVTAFKGLDISDKRIEIVNSLKEISALLDAICERENKCNYLNIILNYGSIFILQIGGF